eukprot:13381650-Heterocapsa_arctica.AAC.1
MQERTARDQGKEKRPVLAKGPRTTLSIAHLLPWRPVQKWRRPPSWPAGRPAGQQGSRPRLCRPL